MSFTSAEQSFSFIPSTGLLFGLMLTAALAGGYAVRLMRIPRVVGYLAGGVAVKLALQVFAGDDGAEDVSHRLRAIAEPLKPVKDLALGIILFSIGGVLEPRHLRSSGREALRISIRESGLTFALVFAAMIGFGFLAAGQTSSGVIIAFAALLACASVATAPAATLFVLREYDAKGPTTDAILSVTGLNNVGCIVAFHVCFALLAALGVLSGVSLSGGDVWLHLAMTTVGSVLLGVLLGFVLSLFHARLPQTETVLILIAALTVVGGGERWLMEHRGVSYNSLLTAIVLGATFASIAIDPYRLKEALEAISRPILVAFFAMAGYELHLADLLDLHLLGVGYIVCRLVGKVLGAYWGIRSAGAGREVRPYIGAALLCQAAVVIGLADFVATHWQDDWARRFVTVVLGSVIVFELCGPLLIKWVVKTSGEVKAVTLLRRVGPSAAGSASSFTLTWQAMLRALGSAGPARAISDEPLQVRHIMRTNFKTISADADFDEVLRIVEHSRFSDFPVVDEDQALIGIIRFRDIREILYDPYLAHLMTAVDLANPQTAAVPADMGMKDVLHVFQEGDVGSLPVVDREGSRHVVGIIEQRDLLRAVHLNQRSG